MKIHQAIIIGVILFLSSLVASIGICQDDENLVKNLTTIEGKMASINTLQTKFVEVKNLALFKQELKMEGVLYLKKPSYFAWHMISPLKQRIIVKENNIEQWDEDTDQVQRINIKDNPTFSIVTDQMRRWVSGSYLSLMKEYDIDILQYSPIKIKFIPRDESIASKMIKSIVILFQEDEKYIDMIDIEERNGDSTKIRFLETDINVDLDPQVWKAK